MCVSQSKPARIRGWNSALSVTQEIGHQDQGEGTLGGSRKSWARHVRDLPTLKPVHHAIQDAAGDDSPTGVGRGPGPTGYHLPGLAPKLKASPIQAAVRLDVVVLVVHPTGHPVSLLRRSPRPCWGSRTAGPTSSQGQQRPLQFCLLWYHFDSPLILYSARYALSHTV